MLLREQFRRKVNNVERFGPRSQRKRPTWVPWFIGDGVFTLLAARSSLVFAANPNAVELFPSYRHNQYAGRTETIHVVCRVGRACLSVAGGSLGWRPQKLGEGASAGFQLIKGDKLIGGVRLSDRTGS